jgi:ATP-binding cassette subfamily F protein 3
MLQLNDVRKSFGPVEVLRGLDLSVGRRDRLGLVGENGCGKSTLLRIIAGELEPDSGSVSLAGDARVGYLEQGPAAGRWEGEEGRSLLVRGLDRLEEGLGRLWDGSLAGDPRAVDELLARRGYERAERLHRIADRLGLDEKRLAEPAEKLSGGELARFDLALLLAGEPDLLLLDEPTNFLDADGLRRAEEILGKYAGAFIVASHDRDLLDAAAGGILELEDGKLRRYHGGYTSYRRRRDEEIAAAWEDYHRAKRERSRLLAGLNRRLGTLRKIEGGGSGAKFAGTAHASRAGSDFYSAKAARMASGIRTVKRRIARLEAERLTPPKSYAWRIRPDLAEPPRSGEWAARAENLRFAHPGGAELFGGLDFTLYRGERVRLTGPNGSGKTTLLRLLLGELTPTGGVAELGYNVMPFYADQSSLGLPAGGTALAALRGVSTLTEGELRYVLARLLFTGDDAFKPVAGLSGGERARLFLAVVSVVESNLLVLDEPTASLDLRSIEALEEALAGYAGSVLFVSHDRAFGRSVAQRSFALTPFSGPKS